MMNDTFAWTVAAMLGKVLPVDIKGLPTTAYSKKK
jgi:hypothetical protein